MRRGTACLASIAIALTAAVALAGNNGHPSLVPWKVVEPGAEQERSPLVLYWVPDSPEELRRSALLTSDELTRFSSHCVAMRVVRLDDFELLRRIGVEADEIPQVVLVDREGDVVAYAEPSSVTEVETMVRHELVRLAEEAEEMLDLARDKAEADEVDAAIAIYREVWKQRCLCPRQGKAAQRALKRVEK